MSRFFLPNQSRRGASSATSRVALACWRMVATVAHRDSDVDDGAEDLEVLKSGRAD
jgi:hypothetical protein